MIAAIGAVSRNGMIGRNGWLPWDIPEELAYFEQKVAGAVLVIGRLTYESMAVVPPGSFVVSRRNDLPLRSGCIRANSVESALLAALRHGKPVFVIGGAMVYAAAWPYCDRFFLTRIEADFLGDAIFPPSIPLDQWHLAHEFSRTYLERNSNQMLRCRFMEYEQKAPVSLVA